MTTEMSRRRWIVPGVGVALGALVAAAELAGHASATDALIGFAIVAGYALGLGLLQARSETATLLSGMPIDERWQSINTRALALAAEAIAIVIVVAFLVTTFTGGDHLAYAWLGAVFAAVYLGGIAWYRGRS